MFEVGTSKSTGYGAQGLHMPVGPSNAASNPLGSVGIRAGESPGYNGQGSRLLVPIVGDGPGRPLRVPGQPDGAAGISAGQYRGEFSKRRSSLIWASDGASGSRLSPVRVSQACPDSGRRVGMSEFRVCRRHSLTASFPRAATSGQGADIRARLAERISARAAASLCSRASIRSCLAGVGSELGESCRITSCGRHPAVRGQQVTGSIGWPIPLTVQIGPAMNLLAIMRQNGMEQFAGLLTEGLVCE